MWTFLEQFPSFLRYHLIHRNTHRGAFYIGYPFLIRIEYEKLVSDGFLVIHSVCPNVLLIQPSVVTLPAGITHQYFGYISYTLQEAQHNTFV